MRKITTCILWAIATTLFAQEDKPTLDFSGYLETYYAYDFNKPNNGERPLFLYNHDRHNEFNVNLALLKATFNSKRVRANLGVMMGTYAQANLILEPELLRYLYEANAGLKLSKSHELWLDMGVMPSHIGFESAIGKDCWTLSRSLIAENSPYYESGAKLNYTTANGQWYFAALLLNGWQRIARVNGSNRPDFGSQVTFKPNDKLTLNYSTYWGRESYTPALLQRFFNNFYVQYQANATWGFIFGGDLGAQEQVIGSGTDRWWSRVFIVRYAPSDKFKIAARAEDYVDPKNVILNITNTEFRASGFSLNFDYCPTSYAMLRFEPRYLFSPYGIFFKGNGARTRNFAMTVALSVGF
jgi:hypothetical protein